MNCPEILIDQWKNRWHFLFNSLHFFKRCFKYHKLIKQYGPIKTDYTVQKNKPT